MRSRVEGSTQGFRPSEAEGLASPVWFSWAGSFSELEFLLRSPAFLAHLLAAAVAGGGTAAWYHHLMASAYSKLTAQGEVPVPAEIRRKLGVGPGSVLEWKEEGERVVIRRADDVPAGEPQRSLLTDFSTWLGLGRRAPENPNPKFRSDADLWG